jgi:hypothetical protein
MRNPRRESSVYEANFGVLDERPAMRALGCVGEGVPMLFAKTSKGSKRVIKQTKWLIFSDLGMSQENSREVLVHVGMAAGILGPPVG